MTPRTLRSKDFIPRERRGIGIACLLALQAACTLAAAPQPALRLPDPRLDRDIQFTVRTGSIGAVVTGLADATELKLQSSPDVETQRLSLLNARAPARKLMRAVEWTHGATWLSSEGNEPYRLSVSKADLERRSAARARQERDGRIRVRQRWEQVRQWAFLDRAGLQELAKTQPAMAQVLMHRRGNAMHRLGFRLIPTLTGPLWDQGVVRMPYSALSPELQQLALESWKGDSTNRMPEALAENGWITMQMGGPPDRPSVWISVCAPREGYDGNLLYAEGWVRQNPADRRAAALANPTPAPKVPLFRKKVTVKDPAFPKSGYTLERYDNALPLLPLVEQIADQVDAPIVLNTDFRPRPEEVAARTNNPKKDEEWRRGQWWLSDPIVDQPLARALDLLCADFEYEWTYADGVIALRHRRWYLPEGERLNGKKLLKTMPPF